jgi:hypothetical protein
MSRLAQSLFGLVLLALPTQALANPTIFGVYGHTFKIIGSSQGQGNLTQCYLYATEPDEIYCFDFTGFMAGPGCSLDPATTAVVCPLDSVTAIDIRYGNTDGAPSGSLWQMGASLPNVTSLRIRGGSANAGFGINSTGGQLAFAFPNLLSLRIEAKKGYHIELGLGS